MGGFIVPRDRFPINQNPGNFADTLFGYTPPPNYHEDTPNPYGPDWDEMRGRVGLPPFNSPEVSTGQGDGGYTPPNQQSTSSLPVAPPQSGGFSPPSQGRGFSGVNVTSPSQGQSPRTGSLRSYRPNLKTPNFNYWRGYAGSMGGPGRATAMGSGSPFSDLRMGGVSDADNPIRDERRRLIDRAFGL